MTSHQSYKNISNSIRILSALAIEKANSGHPGLPLGFADIATILFKDFLSFNPNDPKWINRDRFILSAGHGSMLLYSLLYLFGYKNITLDQIKSFRQIDSITSGHPEILHESGIETTTGPLGQGIANAVGIAISEKKLNQETNGLIDHYTYCMVGDGCLMEGISYEALSLAGHLRLNKLILLWDNNSITIDGSTDLSISEDKILRFNSIGFNVLEVDGHNNEEISIALHKAKNSDKPVLISFKTQIGYGSPTKQNTEKAHGSPLGKDEIAGLKINLNWTHNDFEIPDSVYIDIRESVLNKISNYDEWYKKYNSHIEEKNYLINLFNRNKEEQSFDYNLKNYLKQTLSNKSPKSTRVSSQDFLEILMKDAKFILGGSADLGKSVNTFTSHSKNLIANDFSGNYIKYGIREHAMAGIMNGIALYGAFIPYGGTFLVFSDYLKPALRLSAFMEQQIIYIFTHDSIAVGEDGPTHQPVEHLSNLCSIPNLNVIRPCDSIEVTEAYQYALSIKKSPTCLILSRQNLPLIRQDYRDDINKVSLGGYIIQLSDEASYNLIASGSEVSLALEVANILATKNIFINIISMPSVKLFSQQTEDYKTQVLGNLQNIVIEASLADYYKIYVNNIIHIFGVNNYGKSAKAEDVYNYFNLNKLYIANKIESLLR
jgi:transketolase